MELPSTEVGETEEDVGGREAWEFGFGLVLSLGYFLTVLKRRSWLPGTLLPEQVGG